LRKYRNPILPKYSLQLLK